MATYNFGPVHHSESPTSMNVRGWVDDNGDYTIIFATDFSSSESYFNYSWTIYIGYDTSKPILEIPANTIGNNSSFSRIVTGKTYDRHFHVWAHCGCDGCANNTAPLVIADIDLYKEPSWNSVEVIDRTTRSITVKAMWYDVNNSTEVTNDADATIELYDNSTGNLLQTKKCYMCDGSDPVIFDGLAHRSNYFIKAKLSDGVTDNIYYSEDIRADTRALGCECESHEVHQYSLMAVFKSTVDYKTDYTQSGITRSNCELLDSDLNIIDNANIAFEDEDAEKPANCKVIVKDLVSYTDYAIKYYVTDGVNIAYCTVTLKTIFPYIRLYNNDSYHLAIPYIYHDGSYHMAKIFENGIELNGE